jgi:hypothetical protein
MMRAPLDASIPNASKKIPKVEESDSISFHNA